jgi:ComF family protein
MRFHITRGNEIVLLPVPLHPARERKRGYNQSRLIAEGISEITGDRVSKKGDVTRIRNTRTQTGYSMGKRMKNISGAFSLNNPESFAGNFVIIVDDVFTTGSTVFELAHTLQPAEPADIGILTIALA